VNRVFAHISVEPIDASVAYSTPDHNPQPIEHSRLFDTLRANPTLLDNDGFVDVDAPHTSDASELIADLADSFAVVDENGKVLSAHPTRAEAEAAR
jgi:hypothetical protein